MLGDMRTIALGAALAVHCLPVGALAQQADAPEGQAIQMEDGAAPDPRDEEARQLFEAGRIAYSNGHYEDALHHFTRAHELSGRGALLYNVGQSLDRLRRDAEAIEAFEAFLAAEPEAPQRAQVETRLTILRQSVAEEQARQAALEEERRRAEQEAIARVAAEEQAHQAEEQALAANADSGGGGGIATKWWFWTIVGVVAIGAGVGIGLAVGGGDTVEGPVQDVDLMIDAVRGRR